MTTHSDFTRRTFLQSAALSGVAAAAPKGWAWLNSVGLASAEEDVTQFVDVFIGTGGHGHTFPGATVPFGMVQLSPDTWNADWDHCSGYHISDTSMDFSHTHLSDTGAADLLDVLLMPAVGPVRTEPGPRDNPTSGYRSRFSHSDEHAEPAPLFGSAEGLWHSRRIDKGIATECAYSRRPSN